MDFLGKGSVTIICNNIYEFSITIVFLNICLCDWSISHIRGGCYKLWKYCVPLVSSNYVEVWVLFDIKYGKSSLLPVYLYIWFCVWSISHISIGWYKLLTYCVLLFSSNFLRVTVLFDINYGKIFHFTWFLFFVSVADLSPILVLAYKSSEKNCVLLLLFRR